MLDEKKSAARAVFRVMLSGIFLVAGTNHLLRPGHITGRLESAPLSWLATWMAPPQALVLMAGVALLVGGLALLTGFATRRAALGLLLVVLPITLTVQVGRMATLGPLFKNIGLMGGLLYFATHGGGRWSLDVVLGREGSPEPRRESISGRGSRG
jgi:putative oxidoreductase